MLTLMYFKMYTILMSALGSDIPQNIFKVKIKFRFKNHPSKYGYE